MPTNLSIVAGTSGIFQVTPTPAPEPAQAMPVAVTAPAPDTHPVQSVKTPAKAAATPSKALPTPVAQVEQQPPQVVAQPVPPPPQPQPTKTAPPANAAEVAEMRERANLMSVRVATVRTSFQNLQKQQAASGLSPRSDMVAADQRLDYQLQQAEASLGQGDSANAKKRLDAAERDLEKLEGFLGK